MYFLERHAMGLCIAVVVFAFAGMIAAAIYQKAKPKPQTVEDLLAAQLEQSKAIRRLLFGLALLAVVFLLFGFRIVIFY